MKIAILNIYNGVINRGAETYVSELSKRLSVTNDLVVFQSGDVKGSEGYKIRQEKVDWNWNKKSGDNTILSRFFLDYWNIQILFWTIKVSKILVKEKYDIVMPINGGWEPLIVRLVTWLYRGKTVISGQSGVGWDDRINIYRFPNVFVGLSTKARDWAKRINPFVKSVYIPNGVDLKMFRPNNVKSKKEMKNVLSVGAFTEQKRHELVINAVSKIKNVKLVIVGGGGDLKNKLRDLGLKMLGEKRFEIIETDHNSMPNIYKNADVFTLASKPYESFGIVLVEAMASGLPVVATNDPIRREIVGDAGLFVDPTDTDVYARAIQNVLSTNWGDKPRKQAEKFDWDVIAKQYEELFNTL